MQKLVFKLFGFAMTLISTANCLGHAIFNIQNVSDNFWHMQTESKVIIDEYNSKALPKIVFDPKIKILTCELNSQKCDPRKPIELRVPSHQLTKYQWTLNFQIENEAKKTLELVIFENHSPDFIIEGKSLLEKNILFNTEREIFIISPLGEIVLSKTFNFSVSDFKQHDIGGERFYSYIEITGANAPVNAEGYRVLLDKNFHNLERLPILADSHEFLMLGRHDFVFSRYSFIDNIQKKCFIEQSIDEYKNSKLETVFKLSEFYKLGYLNIAVSSYLLKGRKCLDSAHINAAQKLDDDDWIISLGIGSLLRWDRKNKKAKWIFGGPIDEFDVPTEFQSLLIHTPIWFEKSQRLIIFDNGNIKQQTRLLDFDLDIKNKRILHSREISLGDQYSEFGGGVTFDQNGVYSIAFGKRMKGQWDFIELQDKRQTMKLRLAKSNTYLYRVYRGEP